MSNVLRTSQEFSWNTIQYLWCIDCNGVSTCVPSSTDMVGCGTLYPPSPSTSPSPSPSLSPSPPPNVVQPPSFLPAYSPRPNKTYAFQREPPEGCEKVRVWEEAV